MRYILTAVFILITANLFAQQFKEPKFSFVYINYNDSSVKARIYNTSKKSVFAFNSKTYYWYSHNNIHHSQGMYDGKILNGPYSVYNRQNNLTCKGYFRNGIKSGKWYYWREDGTLIKTEMMRGGVLNGNSKYYNEKGVLYLKTRYRKGLKHGAEISYADSKRIKSKYKKGKLIVKEVKEKGSNTEIKSERNKNEKKDSEKKSKREKAKSQEKTDSPHKKINPFSNKEKISK